MKLTAALNVDGNGNPIQQTFDGATHGPAYATVSARQRRAASGAAPAAP